MKPLVAALFMCIPFHLLPPVAPLARAQSAGTSRQSADSAGDGGPATLALLRAPVGVAVDTTGNVYVAERAGHRVRRVDAATGVIRTVAGTGSPGYSGDGGPAATAQLASPEQIALDRAGNLYVADRGNHRIRRVDARTGVITTVAGSGESGFSGDGGPAAAARLDSPFGVALDEQANIYIADTENQRIRWVAAATGIIETVAGNGTWDFSGDDGPATSAALARPHVLTILRDGSLLIGDSFNQRLRRIDQASGVIRTVAGTGALGSRGDGEPASEASFGYFGGLAVAPDGDIVLTGVADHRVRRIDAHTGIITVVAGDGRWTFDGDGGPASSASLHLPTGVAVDAGGNLYVGDLWNGRVRRIDAATGTIATIAGRELFPGSREVGFHFHYHADSVRARLDAPVALAQGSLGIDRRTLSFGSPESPRIADLHLPASALHAAPVVVLIHGRNDTEFPARSWEGLSAWASLLASHGFAAAVFEHRLGTLARSLDSAASDLDALLDAIDESPDVDGRRICLLSFAGGSTLLAPSAASARPGIRCMLAFSPHTALDPPALWDWYSEPGDTRQRYTLPRRVARGAPPIFVAAGARDRSAITESLQDFVRAARSAGVTIEVSMHPTGGPDFERLIHDDQSRRVLREALAFLRRQLER